MVSSSSEEEDAEEDEEEEEEDAGDWSCGVPLLTVAGSAPSVA